MALTLQNLKLGGNLEFSWYSCNILRYCSNRCIVCFFIPEIVRPKLTESFPFNYMLKSKFSLSRHLEYANEQITYHFWLCMYTTQLHYISRQVDMYTIRLHYISRQVDMYTTQLHYIGSYSLKLLISREAANTNFSFRFDLHLYL